jgi:hypothetical protein
MDIQVNKSKGEVNKCYTTEIIQQEEKSNKSPVRGLQLKTSNTIFTALRTTTEARIHRIQLFPFATANFAPATVPGPRNRHGCRFHKQATGERREPS